VTLSTSVEQELAQRLDEIETQEAEDEVHSRLTVRSLAAFLTVVSVLAIVPLLVVVLV
jgi:hypothetical protein